jgi:hypothetical protein
MTPSQGIAAFGTLLKIGDGQASESFATIAEVTNIDWSGLKAGNVDITNHSSTGRFKEIAPTTIDPGTVKFTVNFLPNAITQGYTTGLVRDMVAQTLRHFQLVFPNVAPTTWAFSAYVSGPDIKMPVDGKFEGSFTLEITGQPTFA